MTAEEFWDATPRELDWAFDAAAQQIRRDQEHTIAASWWTAAMYRAKTLKPLKSFLDRLAIGQPQTPRQQRNAIETIAAQYGLKIRRKVNDGKDRG